MTRGGLYGEIQPELEENPEGGATSKNETSSIVLPSWAILVELFLRIALAGEPIFVYEKLEKAARRAAIFLVHKKNSLDLNHVQNCENLQLVKIK